MSGLGSVKRWLRRNRKQYKRAVRSHLALLTAGLEAKVREESEEVERRSVLVGSRDLAKRNVKRRLTVQDERLEEVAVKNRVTLKHLGADDKLAQGEVKQVSYDGKVWIKLREDIAGEIQRLNEQHQVDLEDERSSQERIRIKFRKDEIKIREKYIRRALERFAGSNRNQYITNFLLGNYSDATNVRHKKARLVIHKRLAKPLEGSQRLAVEESMRKRISLVEGVTGGGKSVVAANIAFSSSRLFGKKILLCSPVQASLDQLADLLYDADLNVIRLPPMRADQVHLEDDEWSRPECSLDRLVDEAVYLRALRRLRNSMNNRLDYDRLNERARLQIKIASNFLKQKISRKLLRKADVICCSPLQAGHPLLAGIEFSMLIIDDAHLVSELESMVPLMVRGLKQVTFLSDMRLDIRLSRNSDSQDQQSEFGETENGSLMSDKRVLLRPERAIRLRTRGSRPRSTRIRRALDEATVRAPGQLIERSLSMGLTAVALNYQLRMPKALAQMVNELFFAGRMRTDIKLVEFLRGSTSFHWLPKQSQPTALFDLTKSRFLTTTELVSDIVTKIQDDRDEEEGPDIGVIYNLPDANMQRDLIGSEVGLVRDFLGREKDYIILACKPRNYSADRYADCDFTRNNQALCVALTRARRGLFIVARLRAEQSWSGERPGGQIADTLQGSSGKWCRLIEYYKKNELVV